MSAYSEYSFDITIRGKRYGLNRGVSSGKGKPQDIGMIFLGRAGLTTAVFIDKLENGLNKGYGSPKSFFNYHLVEARQ